MPLAAFFSRRVGGVASAKHAEEAKRAAEGNIDRGFGGATGGPPHSGPAARRLRREQAMTGFRIRAWRARRKERKAEELISLGAASAKDGADARRVRDDLDKRIANDGFDAP